jgi:NDP-sugar pyrophosphorylase family protein
MKATKVRLTITLPEDLLETVDSLVDRQTIRNRSHAVEHLLRRTLSPTVRTAVILAGGPSEEHPPALKKINDRPLIHWTMDHLKKHGFNRVIICAGSSLNALRETLGSGEVWGVKIVYVEEPKPLGTAGALRLAQPHLSSAPFLVVHADVLTTLNLTDFIEFHIAQGTLATMAVKPRMSEKKYGQVFLQGNKIIQFLKTGRAEGISIVNTGLYVLQPSVLEKITPASVANLETDIFPELAQQRELSAYIFQGIWYDISTQKSYGEAAAQWNIEK